MSTVTTQGQDTKEAAAEAKEASVVLEGKAGLEDALTTHPTQPVRVECGSAADVKTATEAAADAGRASKVSQPQEFDEKKGVTVDAYPATVDIEPLEPVNGVAYVRLGK